VAFNVTRAINFEYSLGRLPAARITIVSGRATGKSPTVRRRRDSRAFPIKTRKRNSRPLYSPSKLFRRHPCLLINTRFFPVAFANILATPQSFTPARDYFHVGIFSRTTRINGTDPVVGSGRAAYVKKTE